MLYNFFRTARDRFLAEEVDNIIIGVSERNLCCRLAIYYSVLQEEFGLQEYYADTEYNRKQNGEIKTILDEQHEVVTINCDLILHRRGRVVDGDNLIALEMKKSYHSNEAKESDRKRLRALTKESYDNVWSNDGITHPEHVCNYRLGVYFELDTEERTYLIEYYEKGMKASNEAGVF